jgi:hypothetical protein
MPSAANITVKKNDGTTDVVYTSKSPSSGDGSPAIWKNETVGTAQAHQPEFRLSAREASKGAKRAMRATFQWPQIATNTTTGLTAVVDRSLADVNWSMSKNMNATDINEFVSQFANLLKAALIIQCVQGGYSAT